ncbi:MAG: fructose bisphosphate aldolase [Aestuariivita sp.]|nr:fructose bisphosphate aldolase [Aestuariivita sp.]MCY4201105.1 fructose bisphosphate aldolase [Aestuariivita sp.]MCY4288292.1 fructose bisphosphate aldolase [Aestuariivita sp.]MCY4345936.1 fructose bisphosphate aldolase [Aestuariivita sp.]
MDGQGDEWMKLRLKEGRGFVSALDQSGGSTPATLARYGVEPSAYADDESMFAEIAAMRVRIISSPAFTSDKVLGTILFERTMTQEIFDKTIPEFLRVDRGIVPFLKVDEGLRSEANGVQLMKDLPRLSEKLASAKQFRIFGTKMRSMIHQADSTGIQAVVDQQFELASEIRSAGLIPIIEPEVNIQSPSKAEAEKLLYASLEAAFANMTGDNSVILKLTIPEEAELYMRLLEDQRLLRIAALSGGYSTADACQRLAKNPGMIASFSRALTEGLTKGMSDREFDSILGANINQIYAASQ